LRKESKKGKLLETVTTHDLPWQGGEELAPWKTLALSNGRRKVR
jgi:hypothetical protein